MTSLFKFCRLFTETVLNADNRLISPSIQQGAQEVIKSTIKLAILMALLIGNGYAGQTITVEQIQQVINDTDIAANKRDVGGIRRYLATDFYKFIDISSHDMPDDAPDAARLDKEQYLRLIKNGWAKVDAYHYRRTDLSIYIAADGLSGESRSTVTETLSTDGREIVSKVREYARYRLENGQPVIFNLESHTLVGDTTPH